MNTLTSVAVFCGSSEGNDTKIISQAILLGETLAKREITLVYGAAKIGIMGKVAKGALNHKGKVIGVIPEFQKKGLDAVFYWEIVNRARKIGILLGEASWILEDNEMMNRGAQVMNAELYKKYRIYEISI